MEFTGAMKFKALNDRHENLKDCEGMIISPIGFHTHTYEDATGKQHTVLVIYNGKDKKMYKTEVMAFIYKFIKYDESFGDLPDDQKPDIVISMRTSKAGNKYVNFDLMETEA